MLMETKTLKCKYGEDSVCVASSVKDERIKSDLNLRGHSEESCRNEGKS